MEVIKKVVNMAQKNMGLNQENDSEFFDREFEDIDIFLTEFLDSFNRKIMKEWEELGLWNF